MPCPYIFTPRVYPARKTRSDSCPPGTTSTLASPPGTFTSTAEVSHVTKRIGGGAHRTWASGLGQTGEQNTSRQVIDHDHEPGASAADLRGRLARDAPLVMGADH